MTIWHDSTLAPQTRAEALLAELTLAEKVAQLGSFWNRPRSESAPEAPEHHDVAPMEHAMAGTGWEEAHKHGLGQLTRVFGTGPVSVAEGRAELRARQREVRAASRFGLPALAHEECLTGITTLGATVYPAAIAWGASWRPDLVREMAAAIGADLRAIGVHQGLSPLLDVVRDYRWGRVEETCGEDPYLVGTLGTAYVQGLQSQGVHATCKHFVGYPASRAGRNHAPVSMGRRELEDVMLPPFEMAVRGGAKAVMNSYCDIDGVPTVADRGLLTGVLRERWGFDGVVVSDYWSVPFLMHTHHVAPDAPTAAALALRAGLDVELPETGPFGDLPEAVARGLVTEAEVDRAVLRVLTQKAELGLLDPDWVAAGGEAPDRDLDSPGNRAVARRLAEESIVLLQNDGILPLPPAPGRVAVVGPVWGDVRSFLGCYSFPNHVLSNLPGRQTGLSIRSIPEALGILGGELTFAPGCGFVDGTDDELDEAVALASASDLAIITVGDIAGLFGVGTSGEGCDVVDLGLPGRQGELVDRVLDTGTPAILLLVTGRPYALGEYASRAAAIVLSFMPGVEGADAIAGVLTGAVNPSGRLPIAIPALRGGQPGTYLAPTLGWVSDGISNLDPRPLFPFGAGGSYTSFTLTEPAVSASEMAVDGTLEYAVTVANTGDRDGAEVVQLYLEDPWAEVVRPLKQLVGFVKVDLPAGGSRRVTFELHADRFSFTGVDGARIVEPGEILLSAGRSSEDRLPGLGVTLVGQRRVVAEGRVLVTPVQVA